MATVALKATFSFKDYSTQAVTMSPFATNSSAVAGFKNRVKEFNSTGVDAISDTFISSSGANVTAVKSAEMTVTNQTLLYSKTAYLGQRALNDIVNGEGE